MKGIGSPEDPKTEIERLRETINNMLEWQRSQMDINLSMSKRIQKLEKVLSLQSKSFKGVRQ